MLRVVPDAYKQQQAPTWLPEDVFSILNLDFEYSTLLLSNKFTFPDVHFKLGVSLPHQRSCWKWRRAGGHILRMKIF